MSLVWFEGRWFWPVAGILAAIALFLIWAYARNPSLQGWVKWTACFLKIAGIGLLLFALLDPQIRRSEPKPGVNIVAILGDTSASMGIADQSGATTRADQMRSILAEPDLRHQFEPEFRISEFAFDSGPRRVDSFESVDAGGAESSLKGAIDRVVTQMEGQPLAAIVAVTDGALTDGARSLPANSPPVYPVLIEPSADIVDAGVDEVRAASSVFETAPITIDAAIRTSNAAGRKVRVSVVDDAGQTIMEETRSSDRDRETMGFRFLIPAEQAESRSFDVTVEMDGDIISGNNARRVVSNREKGPFRALYVGGQPNWEHKFLRRALAKDHDVQFVSLIRVAKGEAKFDWRAGGSGSSQSHPFFQGQKEGDEAERYDEPVLLRLGVRDASELRDGFPLEEKELFEYDLVILDSIEAEFFSQSQLSLLRQFVSDRGGSLLTLGGIDSLDAGGYERTPLADVLPVYLNGSHAPAYPVKFDLTRAGMLESWARLRKTESDEEGRLHAMPSFEVAHELPSLKPGAQAFATFEDAAGRTAPAIAAQTFGKGRSMVMTVGDWWRWGMQDEDQRKEFEIFWRQVIRGLLADVPRRAKIEVNSSSADMVTLTIDALDADFRPAGDALATLRIRGPEGDWTRIETTTGKQEGAFTADVPIGKSGAWFAEAIVTDPSDGTVSTAETGWAVNREAEEFRATRADHAALDEIARRTGGRVLSPDELRDLPKELESASFPAMETRTEPLWNHAGWLLAAIACLAGEWGLRRWKGLP